MISIKHRVLYKNNWTARCSKPACSYRLSKVHASPELGDVHGNHDIYGSDIYETYDARVEAESQKAHDAASERRAKAIAAADTIAIAREIAEAKEALRHHMSASDVRKAVMDAMQTCANNGASSSCAVMWDVADEIFNAYARKVEKEAEQMIEKAEEAKGGEEWSIKRRTYDL